MSEIVNLTTRDGTMTLYTAAPAFGEHRGGRRGRAEGIVRLEVGGQAGVGGDPGAVELELQAAIEGDP